jgi:ATP-dependent Clp protease ATP-binding subunit ClpA
VKPLRIARPDAAERRLWLTMLRNGLNGAHDDADLEPLVGATDGLSGWQLDALARTSLIRNVPVQEVTRLLDAYRFNVRSNPWAQLDAEMLAESDRVLGRRVIGQESAVSAVARVLQTAYTGVDFGASAAARPRGVFFFVGPTGTGKTELAKAIASLIFGDENALARFDMSEYAQEHAAERLAGAPPGFVGYEQGGELTKRVQERPFSVLLFDEIEKAHPTVLDKFLQILEDGRLTDGRGETALFSQTLVIFTSNTGADGLVELLAAARPGTPVTYEAIREHFEKAVKDAFDRIHRPEIYGRLAPGVVVFDMLRPRHVAGIADRLIGLLEESVHERHAISLQVDRDAILAWLGRQLADPAKLRYGGRQIRNEMEQVRAAYVRYFVTSQPRPVPGAKLTLTVDDDGGFTVAPAQPAGPGGE